MAKITPPYFDEFKRFLRVNAPLSDAAIDLIRPYVSFREVQKGEMVQNANEVCQNVIMVKSGILRNFMFDEGHEITRWFAVEGDVFTSMLSFWDGSPTLAWVETVTKCELWELNIKIARSAMEESEEWRNWLLRMLIEGIAIHEKRDHRFISTDAYTRFKNLSDYRTTEFLNQLPLSVLASYLRMTPRTLSRCRNRYIREKK